MNDPLTGPASEMDDLLADVFDDLARSAPHQRDLAARVRRRARLHRTGMAGVLAGAAAAVVAAAVLVDRPAAPAPAPGGAVAVAPACRSTVVRGVLPEWARTGFTDPEPVMPYVRSASGNVVAILFSDPLTSPPRQDVNNKVLWVWRTLPDVANLHAVARLEGTGPAVTNGLPVPAGPSIVDLPSAGCWRLALTWPGGDDTIDLQYVRR